MEPWISVAEKLGLRILIESHSTRSEAAGDELDGPTLAKMFRAEARAAEAIDKDPDAYRALPGRGSGRPDRAARSSSSARLLNAPPTPYTRERFDDTYQLDARLGPGAARRDLREHGRQPRLAISHTVGVIARRPLGLRALAREQSR